MPTEQEIQKQSDKTITEIKKPATTPAPAPPPTPDRTPAPAIGPYRQR